MQSVDWHGIGRRIAGRRVERSWTQVELAKHAHCNVRSIVKAERGAHQRMALPLLVGISEALGTDLNYLLYGEKHGWTIY